MFAALLGRGAISSGQECRIGEVRDIHEFHEMAHVEQPRPAGEQIPRLQHRGHLASRVRPQRLVDLLAGGQPARVLHQAVHVHRGAVGDRSRDDPFYRRQHRRVRARDQGGLVLLVLLGGAVREVEAAEHRAARRLHDVGELVREQAEPGTGPGVIATGAEDDVPADGVGGRIDLIRGPGRRFRRVHPHAVEVPPEPPLHPGANPGIQRAATFRQRFAHGWREPFLAQGSQHRLVGQGHDRKRVRLGRDGRPGVGCPGAGAVRKVTCLV